MSSNIDDVSTLLAQVKQLEHVLNDTRIALNIANSECKQLEQERDELKAHCEALKEQLISMMMDWSGKDVGLFFKADEVRKQTPQQSLAEIKAKAIEEHEQSKWIKFNIKDQSTWPDEGQSCLTYEIDGKCPLYFDCTFEIYNGKPYFYDIDNIDRVYFITHWQPLPTPPKDKE